MSLDNLASLATGRGRTFVCRSFKGPGEASDEILFKTDTAVYQRMTTNLRAKENKMNLSGAAAVADWWRNSSTHFLEAKKVKADILEITLLSSSHAKIRALDSPGRPKMSGWSLPIPMVQALEAELAKTCNITKS